MMTVQNATVTRTMNVKRTATASTVSVATSDHRQTLPNNSM